MRCPEDFVGVPAAAAMVKDGRERGIPRLKSALIKVWRDLPRDY